MLSPYHTSLYLQRLQLDQAPPPDLQGLRRLHLAHLMQIPFENLDIRAGLPIRLEQEALLDKILLRRRGGFCYELNLAFSWLLQSLGFQTRFLSARVWNGKAYGPEFDHMLLAVQLEAQCWIADVGFGDSFRLPLLLAGAGAGNQELGVTYRCEADGADWILLQQKAGHAATPQYRFQTQAFQLDDFLPMFAYQQTSPNSHFTQKTICSLPTADGRISIADQKMIVTQHGKRNVHSIDSEAEYHALLQHKMGMSAQQLPPFRARVHTQAESASSP